MSTPKARGLMGRIALDPDAPDVPAPAPAPAVEAAPPAVEAEPAPEPATPPVAAPRAPRSRRRPAAAAPPPEPEGRMDYRSFYIADEVFEPFRDAMFWTARNPDVVAEHGGNMSVAVSRWMAAVTADLQRKHNDGARFPAAPKKPKRAKRS